MPEPIAVLRTLRIVSRAAGGTVTAEARFRRLLVWCPGCDALHAVQLVGPTGDVPTPCWTWDGNLDAPTVDPSILTIGKAPDGSRPRCHSFLRAGVWDFLADSTHSLAGQKVPAPPLPAWVVGEAAHKATD